LFPGGVCFRADAAGDSSRVHLSTVNSAKMMSKNAKGKSEAGISLLPFHYFSFDLRQAVAGLFGVMGGRIGFLNGFLEVSSSAFFGVPPLFPTTLLLLST